MFLLPPLFIAQLEARCPRGTKLLPSGPSFKVSAELFLLGRPLRDPAFDVSLLSRADGKAAGGHVLADGGAAAHVSALAHRHRRDELRVRADEGAVLDGGGVLVGAVVVAGDGARADVHRSEEHT